MPETEVTVTIILCTRYRAAHLESCLAALARSNRAPDEVLVVDNSDGDLETRCLADRYSARYVIEPILGLSRARNRGLKESSSDIVAYLDDDAIPDERWLELLLQPFADPQVGVTTGGIADHNSNAHDKMTQQARFLSNQDPRWFAIAAFGGLGTGNNMAFRKAACQGWEFFDERLGRGAPFHGSEEHHAFVRILARGYRAVHVPKAIVLHAPPDLSYRKRDARNAIAYALLLLADFPDHRLDIIRFLFGRFRRQPLDWIRDCPDPGNIISNEWSVMLGSFWGGLMLFLSSRRLHRQ